MANYVKNILTYDADTPLAKIQEIQRFMQSPECAFDFNRLIPMPVELDVEDGPDMAYGMAVLKVETPGYEPDDYERRQADLYIKSLKPTLSKEHHKKVMKLGKQGLENIKKYGYPTWYEWRKANWGTKVNPSSVETTDGGITFWTCNSAPIPIILALAAKFRGVAFSVMYADEDASGINAGTIEVQKDGMVSHSPVYDHADFAEIYEAVWDLPANNEETDF